MFFCASPVNFFFVFALFWFFLLNRFWLFATEHLSFLFDDASSVRKKKIIPKLWSQTLHVSEFHLFKQIMLEYCNYFNEYNLLKLVKLMNYEKWKSKKKQNSKFTFCLFFLWFVSLSKDFKKKKFEYCLIYKTVFF